MLGFNFVLIEVPVKFKKPDRFYVQYTDQTKQNIQTVKTFLIHFYCKIKVKIMNPSHIFYCIQTLSPARVETDIFSVFSLIELLVCKLGTVLSLLMV